MNWLMLVFIPFISFAKVRTEKVIYEHNGTKMEGVLAYDDKFKLPRPGILVFHEWMGNGPFTEDKAKYLARLGYVALAADIYGQGVRAKDMKEASELAGKYKSDRKLLQERAQAALTYLELRREVKKDQIGAIGFCFGGTAALELARSGAKFKALVSFHGGLSTPKVGTSFSPKLLILHGGDDPYVPETEVLDFQKEMRDAKADWQFISYGNTVHSFTNPAAGNDNSKGAAFNKISNDRAFREMENFFKEVF